MHVLSNAQKLADIMLVHCTLNHMSLCTRLGKNPPTESCFELVGSTPGDIAAILQCIAI